MLVLVHLGCSYFLFELFICRQEVITDFPCSCPCTDALLLAGGGDTGEELDISLLRITLFHEYWQGLLHQLDLATLRANSAVSLMPFGSKPTSAGSASTPTDQPTSLQPSSPAASITPSDAVSPAQNLNQAAASSTSLAEQGGITSSSSQAAAGAQVVDRLQEPEKQASTRRQLTSIAMIACIFAQQVTCNCVAAYSMFLQLHHCCVTPQAGAQVAEDPAQ